jgi:hypothetical protein
MFAQSFVAGLRHDGIVAPFVLDGAMLHEADFIGKLLLLQSRPQPEVTIVRTLKHRVFGPLFQVEPLPNGTP